MEKPLSIVLADTKNEIFRILYESRLIPALAEIVAKDVYDEVHNAASQQYSNDLEEYNSYLNSKNTNNVNKDAVEDCIEELPSEEV